VEDLEAENILERRPVGVKEGGWREGGGRGGRGLSCDSKGRSRPNIHSVMAMRRIGTSGALR